MMMRPSVPNWERRLLFHLIIEQGTLGHGDRGSDGDKVCLLKVGDG